MAHENLLGEPPPAMLPENHDADQALASAEAPAEVAARFPAFSAAWKGYGPIPWDHQPNRGFLRSLYLLGVSAAAIGEDDEAARCREFLADSSPEAAAALAGR